MEDLQQEESFSSGDERELELIPLILAEAQNSEAETAEFESVGQLDGIPARKALCFAPVFD